MDSEPLSDLELIGECTDSYRVQELPDGSSEIAIRVPARFRDLVLEKMSGLRVSREEYFSCMPHHDSGSSAPESLPLSAPASPVASTERTMASPGLLGGLQGHRLTSVQFVHDYLQLHFDELRLTVNAVLNISAEGRVLSPKGPGWCEALCRCIGACVVDLSIETDVAVRIQMDNGCRIEISLRPADQIGPEAGVFENGHSVVVVFS